MPEATEVPRPTAHRALAGRALVLHGQRKEEDARLTKTRYDEVCAPKE